MIGRIRKPLTSIFTEVILMKVIVVKSPRAISGLLRMILGIKKDTDS